jgi:hypothetical protein
MNSVLLLASYIYVLAYKNSETFMFSYFAGLKWMYVYELAFITSVWSNYYTIVGSPPV